MRKMRVVGFIDYGLYNIARVSIRIYIYEDIDISVRFECLFHIESHETSDRE